MPPTFALLLLGMLLLCAMPPSCAELLPAINGDTLKAKAKTQGRLSIVLLKAPAVAQYTGDIEGMAATNVQAGSKIDRHCPNTAKYMNYQKNCQNDLLAAVGVPLAKKVHSYGFVVNGFSAELTDEQAAALRVMKEVLSVTKDELMTLDTTGTPSYLGLDTPVTGIWVQLGGNATAGAGVKIGMIDSGIWMDHPSFQSTSNSSNTPGCQVCNAKVVGCKHYGEGFGGEAGIKAKFPYEEWSCKDMSGHGSHTASTAAGNNGIIPVTPVFRPLSRMSGMAPGATISVYKVCWGRAELGAGCQGSDNVAAIDDAVADGVDTINFSISGTSTNFGDPVEIAFLRAAAAGVFVAASAGNSGPTSSTVAHPSPWITTVAASTHVSYQATATLGNNDSYTGISFQFTGLPPTSFVDATAVGYAGAAASKVSLCYSASSNQGVAVLDPVLVTGKVVLCMRGTTARTDKSKAVFEAGGVGMILVNPSPMDALADIHSVPTIHVADTAAIPLKAYATLPVATVSFTPTLVVPTPVPATAGFSSRGPLLAGNGNLLKPDITAPGVDVLAVVSPANPAANGRFEDFYSGTSMSSPHIAGIAALFKAKYPSWSPMAIKSALMTSANPVLADGSKPFSAGAGHVNPNEALNPGLVYDSNIHDWYSFLCSINVLRIQDCTLAGECAAATNPNACYEPSNLNGPSIAIGALVYNRTITRTLTNVGRAGTYTATLEGLVNISAVVSPCKLTFSEPGESKQFNITFTTTTATLNQYSSGYLMWRLCPKGQENMKVVRSPIVVRPVALDAPASVEISSTGSASYTVTFGYSGPFLVKSSLVPASITNGSVTQDGDQSFNTINPGSELLTGAARIDFTIPAGTVYARISLFASNAAPGSDLDLYIYQGSTLVGVSGNPGSDEQIDFRFPPLGTSGFISLIAYVHGFYAPSGSSFKLHVWAVGIPSASPDNMAVTTSGDAIAGTSGTITVATTGTLQPGMRYFGLVAYSDISELAGFAPTLLTYTSPLGNSPTSVQ